MKKLVLYMYILYNENISKKDLEIATYRLKDIETSTNKTNLDDIKNRILKS